MATVKEIYRLLDRKAPFRYQMDFDNAGFLVGRGRPGGSPGPWWPWTSPRR